MIVNTELMKSVTTTTTASVHQMVQGTKPCQNKGSMQCRTKAGGTGKTFPATEHPLEQFQIGLDQLKNELKFHSTDQNNSAQVETQPETNNAPTQPPMSGALPAVGRGMERGKGTGRPSRTQNRWGVVVAKGVGCVADR